MESKNQKLLEDISRQLKQKLVSHRFIRIKQSVEESGDKS